MTLFLRASLVLLLFLPTSEAQGDDTAAQLRFRGTLMALDGRLSEAESLFTRVLTLKPGDALTLNNLGNLALLAGDPARAEGYYSQAVQTDSTSAGIRLNRALALDQIGRQAESREQALTGVELAGGIDEAEQIMRLTPIRETRDVRRMASAPMSAQQPSLASADVRRILRDSLRLLPASTLVPPSQGNRKIDIKRITAAPLASEVAPPDSIHPKLARTRLNASPPRSELTAIRPDPLGRHLFWGDKP
jgi:tetratricopeptide (TPR) repeat protein